MNKNAAPNEFLSLPNVKNQLQTFLTNKSKQNKNDLNKQHVTLIKSEGKEYDAVREKYRMAQMRLES